MKLTGNSWHTRWFHYVQKQLGSTERYRHGTTLCHYVRVCFLWGGLFLAFWSAIFAGFIAIVFVAPFYGLWIGPFVIAFVASAIGVGFLIFKLIGRYGKKLAPVGSVVHCAYEHAKAVKGRFCPIIKFDDQ